MRVTVINIIGDIICATVSSGHDIILKYQKLNTIIFRIEEPDLSKLRFSCYSF